VLVFGACGGEAQSGPERGSGGAGAGGNLGASGRTGQAGTGNQPIAVSDSAEWPMPNSAELGLPNPARYDGATTEGVVHDLVTGLDWLQDPGVELYTRADALRHCDELSFAGMNDWRAPAFIELVSLFDVVPNDADPAVPLYIAPIFAAQGRFWSTSPVNGSGLGRLLDFTADGCGASQPCSVGVSAKEDSALGGAFCVRSSQPPATSTRYRTSGDGVNDLRTGLTWQNVPAAVETASYADAVNACAALGNGARLPSINELLSILVPVLDTKAFPNWPSNAFAWSSSTIPAKPDSYWAGAITGATEAAPSTRKNRVVCVH